MNNLIDQIRSKSCIDANLIIKLRSGIVDFFSSEGEKAEFIATYDGSADVVCEDRVSYGDWQTPMSLAEKVCDSHILKYGRPDIVIEPTCGLGAFVLSALGKFPDLAEIHAIDINYKYTRALKLKILQNALVNPRPKHPDIYIYNADFFEFDFYPIIKKAKDSKCKLAIIGNPPWVTNSRQGKADSRNIPIKQNNYGLKGIDAITGKSNFDISEYMTSHLLGLSQSNNGAISFLLKNSVIRNIVSKQKSKPLHIGEIEQGLIDAQSEFNVSVDSSCFTAQFDCVPSMFCDIKDFYTGKYIRRYGWIGNSFVSDTVLYRQFSTFDNHSDYEWRSGIKHDCSLVLELARERGNYINGLGETVEIEDDLIYPLLKSSDIHNYKNNQFRKYIIVPQYKIGEDISRLKQVYPLAYSYLMDHKQFFTRRKSIIYRGKNIFSVFGVGEYTFKPYKIVVSSMYKSLDFILVSQTNGKPVIVDDTCYQLDFNDIEEAIYIYNALNSKEIQSLLKSLIFMDAKRVITKSLLMRLDLTQFCRENGIALNARRTKVRTAQQLSLFE